MIELILEFLQDALFRDRGDAVMAWVQFVPLVASAVSAGVGAASEGRQRRRMEQERRRWNAENDALFNRDFYSDFTQRADAQNIIRQMREEMNRQSGIDRNTAAVMGTTHAMQVANKEARNKGMANLFGGLAAQGQQWKDNVQARHLARRHSLQGLEHDIMNERAHSSNNLLYNGINALGSTDWASIMRNQPASTLNTPQGGLPNNGRLVDDTGNMAGMAWA